MKRRELIKLGVFGTVLPKTAFSTIAGQSGFVQQNNKYFKEPPLRSRITETADVIVCGGGPAGIAAAIAAARSGAKTRLIELNGCLGGVWTAGLLSNLIDHKNKQGIMEEIIQRLEFSGAQISATNYDAEEMKILLEEMCLESGVEVRLHTRVVAAYVDNRKRLETIITESQSGREAWRAKAFIDTTGNGDLAALAGCTFDLGHPDSGKLQPASMMAILTGITRYDMVRNNLVMGSKGDRDSRLTMKDEIRSVGLDPSYGLPTLFSIRDDLFAMMANHEYGMNALDAQDITDATLRSRREVHAIVNSLRNKGGIWRDLRIVATSEQIGIREGRRIKGYYTLTSDDLVAGARFEDAVCRVNYMVDIHSLDGGEDKSWTDDGVKAKPYDIPLRSLIARDVNGLMMAGRCISGDFFAHASYRVTGNAVAMGQAAGVLGALSAESGKLPHLVHWEEIKPALEKIYENSAMQG